MLFKHAPELADLGHPGGIVLGHHMKVEEILLHISMLAVEVIRSLRGSMIPKRGVNDVFFLKSMFGQRMLDVHEQRSEEHTSELQSLMRISYAVFCLKKKTQKRQTI